MRPAPSRLAPLALAAVTLGVACLQGARAPNVAPRGTLAPGDGDSALARTDGPFGVVFASPRGITVDPSEITVVWNRPMRALEVAGQETPAPVVISPAVKGQWVWVGTTGVVFNPDGQLPRATDFTVTVPDGTRALDGSTLAKPYVLKFSTARPKLEYVDAAPGAQNDLRPESKLALRFNQPIADAEILRAVHLSVGDDGKTVPFEIKRPDAQNDKRVEITPRSKLPLDTAVHVRADKGMRGREGPLVSSEDQGFDFRTYGPLSVVQVTCNRDTPNGKCASDNGLSIELSNPVKFADLKRAIKLEPPIKIRWPGWMEDETLTTSVAVWGRFSPGKAYTVRVAGGALRDVYGQPLGRAASQRMEFDHVWPTAEIGLMGSLFEPSARRAIPVASVNVRELEVATAPLDRGLVFMLEGDDRRSPHTPSVEEIRRMNGGKVVLLRPSAAVDRAARHPVLPEDVLGGKDKRGPLAISIGFTERPGTRSARRATRGVVAQVTDLAISAKVSPHGSLVWVTRLSSAAPVAGASVTIARADTQAPETFTTDASGFALVPPTAFTPVTSGQERGIIFVKLGDDWTYRRVGDAIGSWRLGASVDLGPDRPFGMMFTDRGIYRPGETVRMKGIFREEARVGTKTPAGRVVDISVSGPDGEVIHKASQPLSSFGTLAIDVKVPDVSRLGTFGVSASVQGSPRDYPDVTADFEVAEFRAAEFHVSVASDKTSYVRGDKATWTARADYLFGAPMSGADAWSHVTRAETSFTPPGLDGFVTGDEPFLAGRPDASMSSAEVANDRSKLDPKGSVSVVAALAMPGQEGPELVTCEAEVTDLSRQSIAGSTTAIVHPGEFYVALEPGPDLFVKASDPVKPRVLAASPAGARVSGVPVTLELVQRRWSVARQQVGGGHRSVTSVDDKVVSTCTVTTGAAPASCALQPTGVGYYLIHATAKDKRGNPIGSSAGIYATGDAGDTSWGDSDKRSVELVPDRKSYEIGQTAHVLVKSPFKSAEALVTVERAGVYTKRRVTLSGPMPTIDVPITEELRPNAFVSVLLVRGRSKAAPAKEGAADVGAPSYRAGYAALPVNPEARRLTLAMKPSRTELRPGDPIEVDVDVKDRSGKPARAEVTLYAVDEGVLSLIGYKTPDPIPIFGAPRSLKVATIEARDAIARVLNPLADLGLDKGLDGGGGGESAVRRDFRASAYFNPTLVTDDKGHVHASFKLPDALTTYRLMAVAASEDDRFGYAQDRVVTSRPLMARPAFPRFLRAGDQIDAGVILTSKGLPKAKIDVEITAEGLVVKGDARRSIDLDANGSAEVRFTLDAPKAGDAKVRFKASGGGSFDVVEITREVKIPLALEAVALYGDTTQASAEKLGDLSAIRDDTGGLDVSLSSTALVGLGSGAESLIEYPYGCTEQLTSKLVPMLPLRDLAEAYKVTLPKDTDRVIAKTIAEILTHQRGDGSFGLWADSPEGSPWVTAYALWGLDLAKKHKATVPDSALADATAYLRNNLAILDHDPILLATGPFILDVLAERGAADPGRVGQLIEKRDKLPLFSVAQLLHAAVISKSDAASIDKLVTDVEGHVRLDANVARAVVNAGNHYAVLMDSEERTSAMVLRGLLAARPSHPLASKLAMGLLASRKGGTWRNTQETAWSLLALDDYRHAQEKTEPDFTARVFLGEAELFNAPFHGRSLDQARKKIPTANLVSAAGAPLAFDVDGKGRLFYEARLRYAKKVLPKQGLERGFYVKKTMRAVTPEALERALQSLPQAGAASFKGGDLVLVDIVVVTPSPREFVVIDDPLPAGFEAVDAKLATTAASMNVDVADSRANGTHGDDDEEAGDEDELAAGQGYLPNRFLREIRDDRVLFFVDHMSAGMFKYRYLARATALGSFVTPPTRAEEMYTPEVFGRTGAEIIRVMAK